MVNVRATLASQGDAKKVNVDSSKTDTTDDKGGGNVGVGDGDGKDRLLKVSECQKIQNSTNFRNFWRWSILILSFTSILFCAYLAHRQVQTGPNVIKLFTVLIYELS